MTIPFTHILFLIQIHTHTHSHIFAKNFRGLTKLLTPCLECLLHSISFSDVIESQTFNYHIYEDVSQIPTCLFIFSLFFFWLRWVFIAALGLSLVAARGGCSLLQCAGFSLQWLLLLRSMGSRRTGFSSCSTQAQ